MDDLAAILGAVLSVAAIVVGAAMIFAPAGWIVGGVFGLLICIGYTRAGKVDEVEE